MEKIYNLERLLPNHNLRDDDKEIIFSIIKNIVEGTGVDIQSIAEENFTSTSSISRLVKRAGFKNYKEFVFYLNQKFQEKCEIEIEELPFVHTKSDKKRIEKTFTEIFQQKKVFLYGEGFCQFLVSYMYRKLILNKIYAIDLDGVEISLVSDGTPYTLIVFSDSGENKNGLIKIQECQSQGGKAITFTSSPGSSFTQVGDISFVIDSGVNVSNPENIHLNYFYGNCLNFIEYLIHQYLKS